MTIVIQGHFIVTAIITALIWAWVIIPRRRDTGFLNMRPLARFCLGVVGSFSLWLGYCIWRLYA